MIDAMKEAVVESAAFYLAWGGLLIGLVFGFIVQRTNFCTMGSLSDIVAFEDYRRFRAWLLAGAVSIIGATALALAGIADLPKSMYLTPNFNWGGNIIGGLIFGFGMVYSGGCVSRNLVRAGGGDLRSFLTLIVIGIFAFMTIGGLLGPLRVALIGPLSTDLSELGYETQGLGEVVANSAGLDAGTGLLIAAAIVAGALLIYCFKDAGFRSSPAHLIAGVGIGLCVTAGWFLTGLAFDEFADVPVSLISLSYVRPAGETLDYAMRYTALGAPNFAVVTTLGAILGGFVGAISQGRFALTSFANKEDLIRNMFGAALMGIGGVLALGCTVGQAVTGFSTLAIGSVVTFIAIVLGGVIGLKRMYASM